MYWHDGGFGWFGGILMVITLLLFWGLIVAALVALLRYLGRSTDSGRAPADPSRSTGQQILAERFARGEIDEQEYGKRMDILRSGRDPSGG